MNFDNEKLIKHAQMIYLIYLVASLVFMVLFICLGFIFYISSFRDSATISHLFLLLIFLLLAFYFRYNAFHYQRIVLEHMGESSKIVEQPRNFQGDDLQRKRKVKGNERRVR